jgi:diguanylate cyclase (GGDEF)-like protein/PAS domain S-box-containing protein
MRLATFILKNSETILQEWEEFSATLVPEHQKKDQLLLRDHAKQLLEAIAVDLASPQTAFQQCEKSKGRGLPFNTESSASQHGTDRLSAGFSLNAAVSEFRALRAAVTRLWEKKHQGHLPKTAVEDMIRFNEAMDQVLCESIASYTSQKEQTTRLSDTILSSSPDLSFTFDLNYKLIFANKAMTDLLELPLDKIVGKNSIELNLPTPLELQQKIQYVIKTKEQVRGEMSCNAPADQRQLYEYIYVPVLDKNGEVEAVACTARNITARKAAEDENWKKANHDLLTGLPNRRLFRDRLEQSVKHAVRAQLPIALLYIDLDKFKETNDTFGHNVGDQLLQQVADRIRSCARESDTVARIGGDEYTVILQDLANVQHAAVIAEKMINQLANPFHILDHEVQISASIGITLAPQDAVTPEALLKNADQAMYCAKNAGRNRFSFFNEPALRTK